MLQQLVFAGVTATVVSLSFALAQSASPNGVKTLDPPGAIKAEGTWSLGARAGDFIFVAGMQGIDPATNRLVQDPQAPSRHIRRARWSRFNVCLTTISWRSTAFYAPLRK